MQEYFHVFSRNKLTEQQCLGHNSVCLKRNPYIISVLLHSCIITTTNTTTLYGAPVNTNLVLGDITTKYYLMNTNSV